MKETNSKIVQKRRESSNAATKRRSNGCSPSSSKKRKLDSYDRQVQKFRDKVREGPTFICVSCGGLFFREMLVLKSIDWVRIKLTRLTVSDAEIEGFVFDLHKSKTLQYNYTRNNYIHNIFIRIQLWMNFIWNIYFPKKYYSVIVIWK